MDPDTLDLFAADVLRRARAHLPAVITVYNPGPAAGPGLPSPGRARATIGLLGQTEGGVVDKPVALVDAPVVWPRFGGFTLCGPLLPGDGMLACIADRSLDSWLLAGGMVPIDSDRMHEITDAVLLPGLAPLTRALPALGAAGLFLGADTLAAYLTMIGSVTTLVGTPVRLGSEAAAEAVLRGTSIAAAAGVISGILTPVPAATDPVTVLALANANKVAILALCTALGNLSPTVLVP